MPNLLDIQRIFRQDNTGVIGIEMVAGEEGHAAEIDADVAFANTFACGAYRNRGNRLVPISNSSKSST